MRRRLKPIYRTRLRECRESVLDVYSRDEILDLLEYADIVQRMRHFRLGMRGKYKNQFTRRQIALLLSKSPSIVYAVVNKTGKSYEVEQRIYEIIKPHRNLANTQYLYQMLSIFNQHQRKKDNIYCKIAKKKEDARTHIIYDK